VQACKNERSAREYLRRAHKLTIDDVRDMVEEQCGVCVICLGAPAAQVDHDHQTGAIRGVRCFNCNVALGQCRDDPWILRRAAEYLEGSLRQFDDASSAIIRIAKGSAGVGLKDSPPEKMINSLITNAELN
jgi:hypothetical protein